METPSDIPLIIIRKAPKELEQNAYVYIKAYLVDQGQYISQIITDEVISNPDRLRASLLPIALQIFSKLGGEPYLLGREIGGTYGRTFILGIGISRLITHSGVNQYAGFVIVFTHDGSFKFVKSDFSKAEKGQLSLMLSRIIRESINKLASEGVLPTEELRKIFYIIHYSGKELSRIEERAIWDACQEVSEKLGLEVKPAILKIISTTNYRIFDLEHNGYPVVGEYIELIPEKLYIMSTGGYNPISSRYLRDEAPRPILISFKSPPHPSVEELLYSVLALSRMNHAGLQFIRRLPASIVYHGKWRTYTPEYLTYLTIIQKYLRIFSGSYEASQPSYLVNA